MVAKKKQVEEHSSVKASTGYGGKFGVQTDRVDKVCSIFITDFLHVQGHIRFGKKLVINWLNNIKSPS